MTAQRLAELDRTRRRRAIGLTAARVAVAWVAVAGAYFTLPFDGRRSGMSGVRIVGAIAVLMGVVAYEAYRTTHAKLPELRAVAALGLLVPLTIAVFAAIYLTMSHSVPSAFNERLDHISALYFTLTTLSTVGFGDIVARSDGARLVVSIQILADLLLIGAGLRLLAHAARSGLERADAGEQAPPGDG